MYVRVFTMAMATATAMAMAMAILLVVETRGWRSKWSFTIYRYFYGHLPVPVGYLYGSLTYSILGYR